MPSTRSPWPPALVGLAGYLVKDLWILVSELNEIEDRSPLYKKSLKVHKQVEVMTTMLRCNAGCVDNGHHGTPGNVSLAVRGLVEMRSQRLVHSLVGGL